MTDANQEYSLGGFGARLKEAREAMNLSQKDAAVRLHLNPTILQILETENFQKAPPATFIRGYLRSYARLLNFNEEDINAALTQSGLESPPRPLVIPNLHTESIQVTDRHVQWISTVVVLGLFIFVGIWWGLHSKPANMITRSAQPVTSTPQQAPVAQPIQQPQQVVTTATAPNTTTQAPTQPAQSASQTSPLVAQPAPVASSTTQPTNPVAAPVPVAPVAQPNAAPATQPTETAPNSTAPIMANSPESPTTLPGTTPAPEAAPVVAGTPPNNIPGPVTAPGTELLPAATPIPPNTAVASTDTPKKHRRHRQEGTVSGLSMALPEPGL